MSETTKETAQKPRSLDALVRKPRHFWFVHEYDKAEDGWIGPHRTIDAALADGVRWFGDEVSVLYVAQGFKMTKGEREEKGVEYTHEVDSECCLKVIPPNRTIDGK